MRWLWLATVALACLAAPACSVADEVRPGAGLRVAIAVAPAGSPFWATPGNDGQPKGISVDLGRALAKRLGMTLSLVSYQNSDAITQAAAKAEWDVTFIPYDEDRARKLAFGAVYSLEDSTFLVRPGLEAADVAAVDRSGVKIAAVTNTTNSRALGAWMHHATRVEAPSMEQVIAMLGRAEVDAFALGRKTLDQLSRKMPGTRVVDGSFFTTTYRVATPPEHPELLATASSFVAEIKRDGALRSIYDANGMTESAIPGD